MSKQCHQPSIAPTTARFDIIFREDLSAFVMEPLNRL